MDIKNALDFSGKTALVTGASDGIGYGIAQAFFQAGADVVVTGTKEAGAYDNDFSDFRFIQLDVAEPASVESLGKAVDGVDVLVNAVGTVLYKSQEFEREGFEHVMNVNLNGIMHVCRVFRDKLASSKGCVINLDSTVSHRVARNNPAYSASKIALKHLNKVLAWKWGKLGIRVNGISPGAVPTKLTKNHLTQEAEALFGAAVPGGRYGTPADMAGPVLFLASPLAAYVTGVSFPVDGGLTIISGM